MARLTTEARNKLPNSAFAGPNRTYPIQDPSHARNALSRVSQHGGTALKKEVRKEVKEKYPSIKQEVHYPPLSHLGRRK